MNVLEGKDKKSSQGNGVNGWGWRRGHETSIDHYLFGSFTKDSIRMHINTSN